MFVECATTANIDRTPKNVGVFIEGLFKSSQLLIFITGRGGYEKAINWNFVYFSGIRRNGSNQEYMDK